MWIKSIVLLRFKILQGNLRHLAHHTFILGSLTQWQIHIQDLILLELPRYSLTLEHFRAAPCQLAVFVFSEAMMGGGGWGSNRFMGQRTSTRVPGPRFLNCSHDWCFSFDLWVVSNENQAWFFTRVFRVMITRAQGLAKIKAKSIFIDTSHYVGQRS